MTRLLRHKKSKGFSLAELGIAMVILLVIATIATISYFTLIDNSKEVKLVEEASTVQLALVGKDISEFSTVADVSDLDEDVNKVLKYHFDNNTNLNNLVFKNDALLNDGDAIIGEIRAKSEDLGDDLLTDELEVRKLDNNKMKKLIQDNLKGDWYVVDNSTGNSDVGSGDGSGNSDGSDTGKDELSHLKEVPEGFVGIYDVGDLNDIRNDLDGNYILMNDIDLGVAPYNEGEGWVPIGMESKSSFSGTFDGNNYTISNLYINNINGSKLYGYGLFGTIKNATVKNVNLTGVDVTGIIYVGGLSGFVRQSVISNTHVDGSVTSNMKVNGGISGMSSESTYDNVHFKGTVTSNGLAVNNEGNDVGGLVGNNNKDNIFNSSAVVVASGERRVGGLVGTNRDTKVLNSFSSGSVFATGTGDEAFGGLIGYNGPNSSIENSFSNANVEGKEKTGGLIGWNYDNKTSPIKNSYATGNVKGTEYVGGLIGSNFSSPVLNSYSTGTVVGSGSFVGGLIGYTNGTELNNSYWDKETSNLSVSSFGVGKTTSQMKSPSTFVGWENEKLEDGTTIWVLRDGQYPKLWFEK